MSLDEGVKVVIFVVLGVIGYFVRQAATELRELRKLGTDHAITLGQYGVRLDGLETEANVVLGQHELRIEALETRREIP